MTSRPSWTEYFKEIVIVTKKRSPCERLKVGCIIVKDNRIIAQGYNGFLPGCPHQSIVRNNHEQATVHAEINAICDCANRGVSVKNASIYISHYPCINCCKVSNNIIAAMCDLTSLSLTFSLGSLKNFIFSFNGSLRLTPKASIILYTF